MATFLDNGGFIGRNVDIKSSENHVRYTPTKKVEYVGGYMVPQPNATGGADQSYADYQLGNGLFGGIDKSPSANDLVLVSVFQSDLIKSYDPPAFTITGGNTVGSSVSTTMFIKAANTSYGNKVTYVSGQSNTISGNSNNTVTLSFPPGTQSDDLVMVAYALGEISTTPKNIIYNNVGTVKLNGVDAATFSSASDSFSLKANSGSSITYISNTSQAITGSTTTTTNVNLPSGLQEKDIVIVGYSIAGTTNAIPAFSNNSVITTPPTITGSTTTHAAAASTFSLRPKSGGSGISYVGGTTANIAGSTGTTTVVNLPAGTTTNDVVVIVYAIGTNVDKVTSASGPMQLTSQGYTKISSAYVSDTYDVNLYCQYKVMGGTPDTTVTISATGVATESGCVAIQVFRGVDTTSPIDQSTLAADETINSANPAAAQAISRVVDGAWVICAFGSGHNLGGRNYISTGMSLTDFITNGADGTSYDCTVGMGYHTTYCRRLVNYELVDTSTYSNDTYDTTLGTFYKIMGPTPATLVEIPPTLLASDAGAVVIQAFRNVDTSSPIDVTANSIGELNTGNPTPGCVREVSQNSAVVFTVASGHNLGSITYISPLNQGETTFTTIGSDSTTDTTIGIGHKLNADRHLIHGYSLITSQNVNATWDTSLSVFGKKLPSNSETTVIIPPTLDANNAGSITIQSFRNVAANGSYITSTARPANTTSTSSKVPDPPNIVTNYETYGHAGMFLMYGAGAYSVTNAYIPSAEYAENFLTTYTTNGANTNTVIGSGILSVNSTSNALNYASNTQAHFNWNNNVPTAYGNYITLKNITSVSSYGTMLHHLLYYKILPSSTDSANVLAHFPVSGAVACPEFVDIRVFRGIDPDSPVDVNIQDITFANFSSTANTANTTDTNAVDPLSITPVTSNSMIFVAGSFMTDPNHASPYTEFTGKTGAAANVYSYVFKNGYYLSNNSTSSSLTLANNNFTIESFINISETGNHVIYSRGKSPLNQITKQGSRNDGIGYSFGTRDVSGVPYLTFKIGSDFITTSANSVPLNSWAHVAVTRSSSTADTGTYKLYINGILEDSQSYQSIQLSNTDEIRIGRGRGGSNHYFTGMMSNFRLVNGTALYTGSTFSVPTDILTAVTNTSILLVSNKVNTDTSTTNITLANNNMIVATSENAGMKATGITSSNTTPFWSYDNYVKAFDSTGYIDGGYASYTYVWDSNSGSFNPPKFDVLKEEANNTSAAITVAFRPKSIYKKTIVNPLYSGIWNAQSLFNAKAKLNQNDIRVIDYTRAGQIYNDFYTQTSLTSNTLRLKLSDKIELGDVVLIVAGNDGYTPTQFDNSTNKPDGFTLIGNYNSRATTGGQTIALFYKIIQDENDIGTTINVKCASPTTAFNAVAIVIRGASATNPIGNIGVTNSLASYSVAFIMNPIVSSSNNSLIFACNHSLAERQYYSSPQGTWSLNNLINNNLNNADETVGGVKVLYKKCNFIGQSSDTLYIGRPEANNGDIEGLMIEIKGDD